MSKLRRPNSPKPARSDSQAIVDAIVGATVELLRTGQPFSNEAIIERAGVGRASLYRYFPDRGALYAHVFRAHHLQFSQRLADGLGPATSLEDGIVFCVELLARIDEGEAHLRRQLYLAIPLSWTMDEYERELSVGLTRLAEWLAWKRPDLSDAERSRRMFYALALVRGAVLLHLFRPNDSPNNDDLVRDLVPLVNDIVLAPPPQ